VWSWMCCTFTPLYTPTVWCLMKHQDNFTLYEVSACWWVGLLTAQTVVWTIGGGLPFKIMYLFTGNSDKMPFQVMKNGHVVVVCPHCRLGPQWPQTEEEDVVRLVSCWL
jgi:hypothetical protein